MRTDNEVQFSGSSHRRVSGIVLKLWAVALSRIHRAEVFHDAFVHRLRNSESRTGPTANRHMAATSVSGLSDSRLGITLVYGISGELDMRELLRNPRLDGHGLRLLGWETTIFVLSKHIVECSTVVGKFAQAAKTFKCSNTKNALL